MIATMHVVKVVLEPDDGQPDVTLDGLYGTPSEAQAGTADLIASAVHQWVMADPQGWLARH